MQIIKIINTLFIAKREALIKESDFLLSRAEKEDDPPK